MGGMCKFSNGFASRDGAGIAAKQDAESVFRLSDLRFDIRNYRCRGLVLRTCLLNDHLRNLAVLELQFEELDRFGVACKRTFGDFKLIVEAAKLDIAVCDR